VPILCDALQQCLPPETLVVSPDEGRVRMAGEYAQRLGLPVALLHKRRESGTKTTVTHVIGEVRNRPCLIIDDMISTGGTIARSVAVLLEHGARPQITVAATHGVLVAGAAENLCHPAIQEIFLGDTICIPQRAWPRLKMVSVAPLLAAAIQRLTTDESLSDLFPRL
jgi:ribose-phosphate pyrophosphokinase